MFTLEYLKSILYSDPETGIWSWINNQAGRIDKDGYRRISIKGKILNLQD